ncbi:MAG: hypothetical protein JWM95_1463 [Gemmatimonadetes bacterium]|nr:hypothetical protein [Gemmatimonadota bacterium]
MLNRVSPVRRQLVRIAGYALMAAALSSCSSTDGGTPTVTSAISVSLGASSGSVTAGGTSSFTVTVGRSGSFSDAVALTVEGLPTGVTATVNPSTVASGATSATVTVSAAATAAAGGSTLTVRAKGTGVADATATYALSVQAAAATGGFTLSLNPASLSIIQGASGTAAINIARTGTFTGAVDLTVSGAGTGVTTTLSSASVTGTSAQLTVAVAAAAAAGASSITITGTGAGVASQTTTLSLTTVGAAVGSFALSLSPATLSLAAGATGTTTITIARTAPFTGAVGLAVSGAPAGVTAALSAASVATGATTATLTVTVAAGTAATTGNIVITGTAAGIPNSTATLALTTTATTGTPGTGSIIFRFCSTTPTWFAVQDGQSGAWTRVTGTNNTYSFDITNALGGVAYATVNGTTVNTNVYYGNKAELTARGINDCPTATTKNISGSASGISGLDQGAIGFGNRSTVVIPAAGTAWTLNAVPDGPHDLIGSKITYALSGTFSLSGSLSKVIIRRALNPAAGAVIPALDFAGDGVAPATATATIGNLGSDQSLITMILLTANGSTGLLYADPGAGTASRSFSGVPSGTMIAGDMHLLTATALSPTAFTAPDPVTSATLRSATTIIGAVSNQTLTLGPALSTPAVTVAATSPYVRLKSVLPRQDQYNQQFYTNFSQSGTNGRNVTIEATVTWVGAGSFDATIPDFSPVAGWDNNWGLKAGTQVVWVTNSTGYTGALLQPAAVGYTALNAQKAGLITP